MARSQLAELKALRAQGKTRSATYKVEDDADIYDEVDQTEYSKVLRARMAEEDFVVDDNGGDYVDNGAYEWDTPAYSDDEHIPTNIRKKHKGTKAEKQDEKRDGAVSSLFRKSAKPQSMFQKPVIRDQSAIDDIINGLTPDSTKAKPRAALKRSLGVAATRTPLREISKRAAIDTPTPAERGFPKMSKLPSSPPAQPDEETQADTSPIAMPPLAPTGPAISDDSDDDNDTPVALVQAAHVENLPPMLEPSTPLPSSEIDLQIAQTLVEASFEEVTSEQPGLDNKDTAKLFWFDFTELNGNFVLFGRTEDNKSISVDVRDMYRSVYFLPAEGYSPLDVNDAVADVLASHRIREVRARKVTKKYCFGLPDVPAETEYLCVQLPFSAPKEVFESLKSGESFTHVFGLTSTMFETFVVSQNVMGPCWLDVQNFKSSGNSTWAKLNVSVSGTSSVTVAQEQPPMPALNLLGLSIRTRITASNMEIVAISARFYQNVNVDGTEKASQLPVVSCTCVRPIDKVFPTGFKSAVEAFHQKQGVRTITTVASENALLSWFIAQIQRFDPDVIVGHELESIQLQVLLSRLRDLKVQFWSKMGRTKRAAWPNRIDDFTVRTLMSGRLIFDLSNDFGRSLVPSCTEWSLSEISQTVLKSAHVDVGVDIERISWINDGASGLLRVLRHNDGDAALVVAIGLETQAIPLSRQLTNLSGNSWSKTITGSRVDRNNFLLLHEFTREGYIVPDRVVSKGETKRGKAKFEGGKVFEPMRGLHRSNVLVMDFNSLYPSIIQEFNICFTTIDCSKSSNFDDPLPPLPDRNTEMGIFPRLIKTLVDRRRSVRNMIKSSPNATEQELAQWDIRQTALKLTANSMYGCLGFAQSRFYALPLARLTTQQGREILGQTKSLAENENLKVIYGDTDSVMINTGVYTYEEARQIGEVFKKMVNAQYKLLEIDIDNIFGAMILNAKKKYAAIELVKHGDKIENVLVVKGLDLKRREFCQLSKDASMFALDKLLNNSDIDEALESIHDFLRKLSDDVRNNRVPLAKFTIHNQLGKDPAAYHESHKPAHVHVALRRLARGELVRAHDVISYVVTAPLDGETSTPNERARSLSDMRKENRQIDVDYYLQQQILSVVGRICDNIEEADIGKIANCLGLEAPKTQRQENRMAQSQTSFIPFESQLSDAERFKDCQPLKLVCYDCQHETAYRGVDKTVLSPRGIECVNCKTLFSCIRLTSQVEMTIRRHIARYYETWLKCDDAACGLVTRQIGVSGGKRCFAKEGTCRGTLWPMYSSRDLHNQLMFFEAIFDMERACKTLAENGELRELATANQNRFRTAHSIAQRYLSNNGRQYVDMKRIFSFM